MARVTVIMAIGLLASAGPAGAQIITIRTVPISQTHQFDLFPSLGKAMGGVAIALPDSLLDPLSHPGKSSGLRQSRFFGSPGLYDVSLGAGAGRMLPLGALVRSGAWYGGIALAAQQVDLSDRPNFQLTPPIFCTVCDLQLLDLGPVERTHGNTFGFAMLGRELRDAGLSVGGSVFWAALNAVDGVDLLYPGSARLQQSGTAIDVRLGAVKQWSDERSLGALLLYDELDAAHDVTYLDSFWDPGAQRFAQRTRLEENLDHTRTWGLHLEYRQPLGPPGWRIGWVATTNLMSHPKIPNYEIQNIPRDPGRSQAFNLGVGVSKTAKGSTLGLDVVYEPIWSHTWADSDEPVVTALGTTIMPGGKTIENHFRFSNVILRMGAGQDLPLDGDRAIGLRLGLLVHGIHYSLDQRNHVQSTDRSLREGWVEWTPTWGVSLRFPAWELSYRGRVTNGSGRPGVVGGSDVVLAEPGVARNVLVAPSGPLTLTGVRVMSHQVAVSFPFR